MTPVSLYKQLNDMQLCQFSEQVTGNTSRNSMSDQSRPIPIANSEFEVAEIVQVLQPDTDGPANNPSSKGASASSRPSNSPQHSAAS